MHCVVRGLLLSLLLLWLALPGHARAEQPFFLHSPASEALLEAGRAALLDFRFAEAERTFHRLGDQPDGQVAAAHGLAAAALYRALFTDSRATFDAFEERSDHLMEVLDTAPASPWREYLQAEAALQRAVVAAKQEEYVRAALAARTAYRQYEQVIRTAPDLHEAYTGYGLLQIAIGSLPSGYRRLLRVLGYAGDVVQGQAALQRAAEHGRWTREEAIISLALLDITLNSSSNGGPAMLGALHAEHPSSPFFAYLHGYARLANRQGVEAERLLQQARQAGTAAEYFFIDYAEFYLAQALFRQNRFAEAVPFYRHYIERHQGAALKAVAHLEIGLSLEMQGHREEAISHYRQIESSRTYDSDHAAQRGARQRLAAPMTPLERQLLLGANAYDAGNYDEATQHLTAARALRGPDEAQAEVAYRLGRVNHARGRLDEALQAYRYAVEHPGPPEARWAPWSLLHLGEIHAQQGDFQQARRDFEAALAYHGDYDYRQGLEQRAKLRLAGLDAQAGGRP